MGATSAIRRKTEVHKQGRGQTPGRGWKEPQGLPGRSLSQSLQRGRSPAHTSGRTSHLPTPCSSNPPSLWYLCGERETNVPSTLVKTPGLQAPGFCLPPPPSRPKAPIPPVASHLPHLLSAGAPRPPTSWHGHPPNAPEPLAAAVHPNRVSRWGPASLLGPPPHPRGPIMLTQHSHSPCTYTQQAL